jgi:hypothetical protein
LLHRVQSIHNFERRSFIAEKQTRAVDGGKGRGGEAYYSLEEQKLEFARLKLEFARFLINLEYFIYGNSLQCQL